MIINGSIITYITYSYSSYEKKSLYDKYYRKEIYDEINSLHLKGIDITKSLNINQIVLLKNMKSIKGLPSVIGIGRDYFKYIRMKNYDKEILNERFIMLFDNLKNILQMICLATNLFLAFTIKEVIDKMKYNKNYRVFKKRIILYMAIGLPTNIVNIYLTSFYKNDFKDIMSKYEYIGKKYRKLLEQQEKIFI